MRHVLAPIREEPEDREEEGGWIIAAETVIDPFLQIVKSENIKRG